MTARRRPADRAPDAAGAAAADPAAFERRFGYRFRDPSLLAQALTHRSYVQIRPQEGPDYERLEFLGDAVVGVVVAEHLVRERTAASEGELTRMESSIVSTSSLASATRRLGIDAWLRLGPSARAEGVGLRDTVGAAVFEATTAAVYLDGGLDAARRWVLAALSEDLIGAEPGRVDPKTALQEWLQGAKRERPVYVLDDTTGPEHAQTFVVSAVVDGAALGRGVGRTKKEAERAAASEALHALTRRHEGARGKG